MSKRLQIAPGLSLPIDAVTQAIAILAKRRVGKSYTARRFAEQLLKAGQQVVIVDPKGDHWGIRSGADGKSPGLPVIILGGERGDVPLEVSSGEIIAKLAAEERVSMLLDLSLFRKHEVATFMTAFLENLYRLKAREQFRTPLMLEIDEADAIAPQKPQPNEARMLGAAEDIVRRGGQRGLGCILITQRSAVLNKNVLTQVEMIVALRTIAPQDLEAIDAWVEVHGTKEQRELLMGSLPSLPVGDAWFWSPGWPTVNGIFERVHVSAIETFDSGASPKAGEKRVEPRNLADVDLGALTKQMAATIEKAKADDPKELKKKIAQLEADLRKAPKLAIASTPKPSDTIDHRAVERGLKLQAGKLHKALESAMKFIINISTHNFDVAGLDKEQLQKAIEAAVGRATQIVDQRLEARARTIEQLRENAKRLVTTLKGVLDDEDVVVSVDVSRNEPYTVTAPAPRALSARARGEGPSIEGISKPQAKMLRALASFEALGIEDMARSHVAVFADQSPRSSGVDKNFSTLRTLGLIEYPSEARIRLTAAGRSAAGAVEAPASLEQLHDAWYRVVSTPQQRMLLRLIASYPKPIEREELASRSDQSAASSGYDKNLSTLRSLGLIDYPTKGYVAATELLFPEGLS